VYQECKAQLVDGFADREAPARAAEAADPEVEAEDLYDAKVHGDVAVEFKQVVQTFARWAARSIPLRSRSHARPCPRSAERTEREAPRGPARRAYATSYGVERAAAMAARKRELVLALHGRAGLERDRCAPAPQLISLRAASTTAHVGGPLTGRG
jgi:hypothetical protein